jgi:RNA polymerase sigma-70 factor (sigma-E family)
MMTGVRRLREGGADPGTDDQWLTLLFKRHYRPLLGVARLLLGSEAEGEEIVQEAFVKMSVLRARLEDPDAAPAYLRATVVNLSRSSIRRRIVARRYQPSNEVLAMPAEEVALLSEERRMMLESIGRLPRRQRECLVLRYYLDLSEVDTAEALGIAVGSVKSYSHRAIATLQKQYGVSP